MTTSKASVHIKIGVQAELRLTMLNAARIHHAKDDLLIGSQKSGDNSDFFGCVRLPDSAKNVKCFN